MFIKDREAFFMIGAIIGDIAGSTYEFHSIKTKDFPLFAPGSNTTDDSLMSIAVASTLIQTGKDEDFKTSVISSMRQIAAKYPCPMGGYGGRFRHWLVSPHPRPYGSFGNGSAMRVSPCGDVAATLDEALELARQSAEVTHSHPEGIRGAQAVAAAIVLARTGESRDGIRSYIEQHTSILFIRRWTKSGRAIASMKPVRARCRRPSPRFWSP